MPAASPFERSPRLLTWDTPLSVRRIIPPAIRHRLSWLRVRLLSLDLPRHMEFVQPAEEAEASAYMSLIIPIRDTPQAVVCRFLTSLERYAPRSEVILVDDASVVPDTLVAISDFSIRNEWKVIRHKEPLGHSGACAAGGRLATRPYLCLLNSDTVITPWCWRGPKEAFEIDPKIGVAGPSSSFSGNVQTVPRACFCRYYWNDSQIYAFASRLAANCPDPVRVDLPWASGFAFFIRRSLWEELGGFDPELPDYGNEEELCKRVTKMGHRIVWIRNNYIHHFGGQYYGRLGEDWLRSRGFRAWTYTRRLHGGSDTSK